MLLAAVTTHTWSLHRALPSQRLDTYLKENRVRLRQLFDAADADRSGALDSKEMARLIKHVMPEAGRPQFNYFIVSVLFWQRSPLK